MLATTLHRPSQRRLMEIHRTTIEKFLQEMVQLEKKMQEATPQDARWYRTNAQLGCRSTEDDTTKAAAAKKAAAAAAKKKAALAEEAKPKASTGKRSSSSSSSSMSKKSKKAKDE